MTEENDNEIECARCGGRFDMELTRCPHCGVNIYEPEDDLGRQNDALSSVKNALRFPFAIFAGWFITAFVGLLLYIPIRAAQTTAPNVNFIVITTTLAVSLGAFAGGFLYQRIHQGKGTFGNFSQILFGVLLGTLIFLTENTLWMLLSLVGLLIIGAADFFGIQLADKMLRKAMINDLFAPVVATQQRYQDLLAKVSHDRDVAERLIQHERSITPKATRDILIENAIKRWERDNRVQ